MDQVKILNGGTTGWSAFEEMTKDKTVYLYCHDGFRMSLGYKNIKIYNGGWSHWGNQLTLPTVDGEKPYAGDYDL